MPEYVRIRDRIPLEKGGHGAADEGDILTAYTGGEEVRFS